MKKLIVTLGCLLITPLAFAQPSSTDKKQGTTTTEPVNVTGTIIKRMSAGRRGCQLSASQYTRCSRGQFE